MYLDHTIKIVATTPRSHPRFFQRHQRGPENSYFPKEAQGILIFPKIPKATPENSYFSKDTPETTRET